MKNAVSFRQFANSRLQYWRRFQIAGMFLILATFFWIPMVRYAVIGTALGVAGMLRAYWGIRAALTCPHCSADLSFLALDPSYAGTPGAILLPRLLPLNVDRCPHCGFLFDRDLHGM